MKPSNKFIISSRATPNISFYILIADTIMKGSGYVRRVFEAANEVTTTSDYKSEASLKYTHEDYGK